MSESEEVREELLEDELLLRPCLDCLASRSQEVVEGAMELLATLSEEEEGVSHREEQCMPLVNVVRDASSVGFLMEYLNGPNMTLRRCAADCLANITSLPLLAQIVCSHDPNVRLNPPNLAFLVARVTDSSESPEVRQLSCQALANVLHSQASATAESDLAKKLVKCLPNNNFDKKLRWRAWCSVLAGTFVHIPIPPSGCRRSIIRSCDGTCCGSRPAEATGRFLGSWKEGL